MKLKKTKYVVKCLRCSRTGKVEERRFVEFQSGMTGYDFINVDCSDCNGKGTLPVFEEEG